MQHTATLNRRHTSSGSRQQRRPQLLLPLTVAITLFALVGLVTSAPSKRSTSALDPFNVTQALVEASSTWKLPCGRNRMGEVVHNASAINKSTKFSNMLVQINMTLLDIGHWRDASKINTTWDADNHKRKFKFLQPFVRNESSWERRLSVYWAALKLVRVYLDIHIELNIEREERKALEDINEGNRQLLCMVQEYRQVTKRENKTIGAAKMERLIDFKPPTDSIEIKIHMWYIMCRFECYLTNMRKHLKQSLRQLSQRGSNRPHKQLNLMSCKQCSYCPQLNKQCKPANAKHRQQQQQQQLPHQRKHNQAGHKSSQSKQLKQQQQQQQKQQKSSRQPKGGRKGGTRMPKNQARNKKQQQHQQQG